MKSILVVGCAASVWDDLRVAPPCSTVIATNQMILDYLVAPHVGVTLHPEKSASYVRSGTHIVSWEDTAGTDQIWMDEAFRYGSTGLYAVGYAFAEMRADQVILAGVPLDDTPHYYDKGTLEPYLFAYREAWQSVLPQLRGRVVSISGWSRQLLES